MFVCRIEDDYSVSTSYNSDHYLGDNYDASCGLENLFESGFGVVLALANVCPTILEGEKIYVHVDHEDNVIGDSYIIKFNYDSTGNYYEEENYGCQNLHVNK